MRAIDFVAPLVRNNQANGCAQEVSREGRGTEREGVGAPCGRMGPLRKERVLMDIGAACTILLSDVNEKSNVRLLTVQKNRTNEL